MLSFIHGRHYIVMDMDGQQLPPPPPRVPSAAVVAAAVPHSSYPAALADGTQPQTHATCTVCYLMFVAMNAFPQASAPPEDVAGKLFSCYSLCRLGCSSDRKSNSVHSHVYEDLWRLAAWSFQSVARAGPQWHSPLAPSAMSGCSRR